MERRQIQERKEPGIIAIVLGIAAVALCCFAPFLLAALGAASLGAFFKHYFAYFLLFAAALLVLVGGLSYRKWRARYSRHN
jgi:high-affinity Fe2+/Pb2+ permease